MEQFVQPCSEGHRDKSTSRLWIAAINFPIDVGRGEVVAREGLVRCLRDSHLAGAGLRCPRRLNVRGM